MSKASQLAQWHWNRTPLRVSEGERYRRYYPWLPEVAEFSQHAGEKILEIGCGTGIDLLQFAKHGAEAYGIDIADEHLRLARERCAGLADVRFGNGRKIPFPDGSFDYVYSHGVIHHSDEPQKIISEMMRVLKPGGKFNIHVYAKWSYFPVRQMILHGTRWRSHIENSTDPVHIDLYTAKRLRSLFPVPVSIRKVHCPIQILEPLCGWYLIVKGSRRSHNFIFNGAVA